MHWYNVVKITEAVQARSDCVSSQHTSSEARGKNACVKCQYGRLCNVQIVLTFFVVVTLCVIFISLLVAM